MIRTLFNAYLCLLVVCSVTGIISTWRLKKVTSPIKLLPWFILVTFIDEIIASQWAIKYGSNHWVYNIYQVIQIGFFSYTLCRIIENNRMKKLLIYVASAFVICAVTNLCFIQGIHSFNSINYYTGAIIAAFFSGYSLSEVFNNTGKGNSFKKPAFWIAASILLSNTCMIPLIMAVAFYIHFTGAQLRIWFIMVTTVNFIAYCMFMLAFWFHYKNYERSPVQRQTLC